jgi:hypothetical protein
VQSVFIREICEVRHEFVETALREVPLIFDLFDLVLPQIEELLRRLTTRSQQIERLIRNLNLFVVSAQRSRD